MSRSGRFRRGIYVMPTLFTVGNLFCGYSSVVQASRGNLESAAMLILIAALLDGLDGRLARLTGTTSEFGLQFDSLADIVSFGVAPAFLAYHWVLSPIGPNGRIGWSLAFLYVVCAAMRLARFNIRKASNDKRFFAGLPSPMAGCAIACTVFAFPDPPPAKWIASSAAVLVICVATLMISRLRFRSFREIDLRHRRSYVYVFPIAAILTTVVLYPKIVPLVLCTTYLMSAPARWVREWVVGRAATSLTTVDDAVSAEVADETPLR